MKQSNIGFATLSVALLLLIGCAGSSGSPSTTDGTTSGANVVSITTLNSSDRIAFQNNDGTWRELSRAADGKFKADVTESTGRYSVALLRGDKVNVMSLTLDDTHDLNLTFNPNARPAMSIQCTNVPPGGLLVFGTQGFYGTSADAPFDFPFTPVADMVVSRADPTTLRAGSLFARRGLTGNVSETFDYNSTEFIALEPRTWNVPAIPNLRSLAINFETENRGFALVSEPWTSSPISYSAVPTSQMQAGDHYAVRFTASANREVLMAAEDLDNLTSIAFAEPFTATTVKDAAGRHYTFNADPLYTFFRVHVGSSYDAYIGADWLDEQGMATYTATTIDLPGFKELTSQLGGVRAYGFVSGGGAAAGIERYFTWTTRSVLDYYGTGDGRFVQETTATAQG